MRCFIPEFNKIILKAKGKVAPTHGTVGRHSQRIFVGHTGTLSAARRKNYSRCSKNMPTRSTRIVIKDIRWSRAGIEPRPWYSQAARAMVVTTPPVIVIVNFYLSFVHILPVQLPSSGQPCGSTLSVAFGITARAIECLRNNGMSIVW